MSLKCECGSKYFIELKVAKFNDIPITPHAGYRAISEPVNVYMCLNSKCRKVFIPELHAFSTNQEDLNLFEEIISTEKGTPKELPPLPNKMPKPGEIVRGRAY